MCLLSAYGPGIEIDDTELYTGIDNNPDGSGFALVYGDGPDRHLIVQRRMLGEKLVPMFRKLRNKYPDSHALFHSRIGTGGILSTYNCHPFNITEDSVLAHNGIIYTVPKGERRSDTRIFAETKMRTEFRRWQRPTVQVQIEAFIGPHNKMVIISANPLKPEMTILNPQHGVITDAGVWHSNDSYLPRKTFYYGGSGYSWKRDCYMCESIGSIEMDRCNQCGACAWCGSQNCDTTECASCKCKIGAIRVRQFNISDKAECVMYACPVCEHEWERVWRRWDRPGITRPAITAGTATGDTSAGSVVRTSAFGTVEA